MHPSLKHGYCYTSTYRCWADMFRRCRDKDGKDYQYYGERGITVCKRWSGVDGFANFLTDMGDRPDGLTVDRINTNGNYEPGNCRWATRQQQSRNRIDTIYLTKNGVIRPLAEWSDILGIKPTTIHMRLSRGDSDERALRPVKR